MTRLCEFYFIYLLSVTLVTGPLAPPRTVLISYPKTRAHRVWDLVLGRLPEQVKLLLVLSCRYWC